MDKNEKWFIERLSKAETSEPDVSGCIVVLEMLLSIDALPPLVRLMETPSRTLQIRQQAARAVYKIGADYVKHELAKLEQSGSAEIQHLRVIALTGDHPACLPTKESGN